MTRSQRPLRALMVAVVAVVVVGFVAQVLSTDPRSPLVYFTVLNALALAGVTVVGGLWARRAGAAAPGVVQTGHEVARLTFATGAVFAGLVYWVLIAPREGGERWLLDSPAALVAAVALHGVLPIVAVVYLRAVDTPERILARRSRDSAIAWTLIWPAGWGLVAIQLSALGLVAIPYPFLDVSTRGWLAVLGSTVVLLGGWVAVARLLLRFARGRIPAAEAPAQV